MKNYKNILIIALLIFGFGGITLAANLQPSYTPSLLPLITDKYYLGSTSPNLEYNGIYTKNLTVSGTCTGCGGGSGGGSGNVATSTPDVANQAAVFTSTGATPATIGGFSTFTFDSTSKRLTVTNASTTAFSSIYASSTNLFTSSFGVGTSSPEAPITFAQTGGLLFPDFVIDGVTAGAGAEMELNRANNSGTEANIDFNTNGNEDWQLGEQNNNTSDFELWDGSDNPVFTINKSTLDTNIGTTTCGGQTELCVWGDTVASDNIFQAVTSASSSAFIIRNSGNVGIGTSTPSANLTIDRPSVGTTPTPGFVLENPTLATVGAQQLSPLLVLQGNQWDTTPSLSTTTAYAFGIIPVQSSIPRGEMGVYRNLGGVGWTEVSEWGHGSSFEAGLDLQAGSAPNGGGSLPTISFEVNQANFIGSGQNTPITFSSGNAGTGDTQLRRQAAGILQVSTTALNSLGTLISGTVGVGTTTPDSNLDVSGTVRFEGLSSFVTASISGAIVGLGCDSVTTTYAGSPLSSTTAFITTPQSYPGDGLTWQSYLSSSTTITTKLCSDVTVTPAASVYNVKIIR